MILYVSRRQTYRAILCIGLLWATQGEVLTTFLTSSMYGDPSELSTVAPNSNEESSSYTPPFVKAKDVQKTILPSFTLSEPTSMSMHITSFLSSFSTEVVLSSPSEILPSPESVLSSRVPDTHNILYTNSKEIFLGSSDFSEIDREPSVSGNEFTYFPLESSRYLGDDVSVSSAIKTYDVLSSQLPENASEEDSENSSDVSVSTVSDSTPLMETSFYPNFHTPLMSLLVASSSIALPTESSYMTTSVYSSPHTHTTADNESALVELSTVPTDFEHKKLLMLVLRAEDCSRLSKVDFEKMLGKLMAKFGFGDVVPEVSNAKCYSHLNINLTIGSSAPTLRFLPNIDGKNNITVDVLNRTFRIVKLEKIDLRFEKTKTSNTSSHIITKITKHESVAYIAVGVSFGLALIICVSMCCIKCCCLRKSQKRFTPGAKCTHVRLRPEDYTLTPIPRPTSLYVDYYRGSVTADIYSTTSAGSIASTTPTVEQGVVQPFDTSIVPLEDSATLPLDSSRDPSVESVQSDMKTFNIHSFSGKSLRIAATDSKEQLNPKQSSRRIECKNSGVANPTFQRY